MEDIVEEPGQLVARVCAIDIGKAGLVACVRVPHDTSPDRRAPARRESLSRRLSEVQTVTQALAKEPADGRE